MVRFDYERLAEDEMTEGDTDTMIDGPTFLFDGRPASSGAAELMRAKSNGYQRAREPRVVVRESLEEHSTRANDTGIAANEPR